MGRVGRYVKLKASEGQGDVLVEHMLDVAQLLKDVAVDNSRKHSQWGAIVG